MTVVTKCVLKLFEVKLLPAVKEKDKGITKKIREKWVSGRRVGLGVSDPFHQRKTASVC